MKILTYNKIIERIPPSCPVIMRLEGEGYIAADYYGNIMLSPVIEDAVEFQYCAVPNERAGAFFSRKHHKYLTMSGILSNVLKIDGNKLGNWEKLKIYYDTDRIELCSFKTMKTWPPPTVVKAHFPYKEDKAKAYFTLYYTDKKFL